MTTGIQDRRSVTHPSLEAQEHDCSASPPRVVVVGGGFGGVAVVRALRKAPVEVVLVDRRNFHLFQPLLYQVATGGLSPANIATSFRWALRHQSNVDIVMGEVIGFDVAGRRIEMGDGRPIAYDHLVVAAGSTHSYFGQDWEALAPGLKTIEDATKIRSRVLAAFEHADREHDASARRALLTFVVVGGGPTGVELAGALAEISRHTLKHDFRHVDSSDARVLLIEASGRVLSAFPEELSQKAELALRQIGVEVQTSTEVAAIREGEVDLDSQAGHETLACATVLWAAGVQASPLGARLAQETGLTPDRAGRLAVEPDLTLPGHPEISVIGDLASFSHGLERPLPGVAPVAMQQGGYIARRISQGLGGRATEAFRYRDRGSLATIGRARAVVDFGRFHFSGFPAWLLWLFVHIMNLMPAESRLLVLIQWGWSYLTYDRSARLITGRESRESRTQD